MDFDKVQDLIVKLFKLDPLQCYVVTIEHNV